MILQKQSLGVQGGWILSEEQSLHFNKLNVALLVGSVTKLRGWLVILFFFTSWLNLLCLCSGRWVSIAPSVSIHYWLNWLAWLRNYSLSWRESMVLPVSYVIAGICRLRLLNTTISWSLIWASLVLGFWLLYCISWMLLACLQELSVCLLPSSHDIPAWREYSLHLLALSTHSSCGSWLLTRHRPFIVVVGFVSVMRCWCLVKLIFNALPSCTEESFGSIHTLGSWLWILLRLLTVVSESSGWLLASLLDLRLQGVIDTLSLGNLVVEAFWTVYWLHSHIGTKRHALVDMSSRW